MCYIIAVSIIIILPILYSFDFFLFSLYFALHVEKREFYYDK